jgi:hypothetical protein
MNGDELEQGLVETNQAMVDAMMSPDADRAIEIYRRAVAYGMRVPDPDLIESLATQPARRPQQPRQVSRAVPWTFALFGIVAVGASLGWSYSDYNARQEEWHRIAVEQTALAEQRAKNLADYEAWEKKVTDREARLKEVRQKQIARIRTAMEAGNAFEAAVHISTHADEIVIDGEPKREDLELFSVFVDELVKLARAQAPPPSQKE